MRIKTLLKLVVLGALIFVGIKYSLVYVNSYQIKKLMGDEALNARRMKWTAGELENSINDRLRAEILQASTPVKLTIVGTGDPTRTIEVAADYVQSVNLGVYVHQLKMHVTASAEPPAFDGQK